jgi:hypothetical protein
MPTLKFRCIKECFEQNKRFKVGAEYPPAWVDAGLMPTLPHCFVKAEDYEDTLRQKKESFGKITSAGSDPRPTAILIEELTKYLGKIPATWNRSRIWRELITREMAESKTEPEKRKPGRPPAQPAVKTEQVA